MSGTEAALEATSAGTTAVQSRNTVLRRKKLWSGGVISISIPKTASVTAVETPEGAFSFIRVDRQIRGSAVRMYLHTEDAGLIGTNIRATVKVMRKELASGDALTYIDLTPVAKVTRTTHRLSVMAMPAAKVRVEDGWTAFDIAGTRPDGTAVEGVIVLSPPDAKVCVRTPAEILAAAMMSPSGWGKRQKPREEARA